jgi:hypothetical protein
VILKVVLSLQDVVNSKDNFIIFTVLIDGLPTCRNTLKKLCERSLASSRELREILSIKQHR